MFNLNQVNLAGRLTRDPEQRKAGSTLVTSFGLAVNRSYTTQSGEKREDTTFVDCEAWGKIAETLAKYVNKGRQLFVIGRLKQDNWEDANGNKRSKLLVTVEDFKFVDSNNNSNSNNDNQDNASSNNSKGRNTTRNQSQQNFKEADIPF